MKVLCVLYIFVLCVVAIYGQQGSYGSGPPSIHQSKTGDALHEVVVDPSLYINKKSQIRIIRDVNNLVNSLRVKRQFGGRRPSRFGSSQSAANAAANSNFFGPNRFGASAANAQAQGFQSQGPLGGFGASAANTQTQSFTADRRGIQGSAGASGSQVYNLPNGQTINVALANGFSVGPNGITGSNANGLTVTRG